MKACTVPHTIVRYDPNAHGAWVRATWIATARLPWVRLKDLLRRPEAVAIVALVPPEGPEELGWAVRFGDDLVWCYVRTWEDTPVRGKGLASAMCRALGFDTEQPLLCRLPLPRKVK